MAVLKYKNELGNYVPITNYIVQPITPVQQTGSSTTDIMSQNAVTVALNAKANSASLGEAAAKAVDSTIAALSSSDNLPTSAAVASFVEGKGYVTTDTNTTYKLTIGNTTNGDRVNGVDLGTLENKAAAASGTDLSLVTTGEKDVWNNKQDAIVFNTAYNASTNKAATMSDIPSVPTHGTAASGGTDLSVVTTGEMYTWNKKSDVTIGTTAGTAFDGADGATAKAETDFLTGSNGNNTSALTTVAGIPVNKRLVRVNRSTDDSFSLESLPAAGHEIHVIVYASAAVKITIPNTGDYICLNDSTSMNIASGKYGEINVISDGVKGYIRYLGA